MLTHQRQQLIKILDKELSIADERLHCVLATIDVRDFRELNHSFGIECGDQVLQEIDTRLTQITSNRSKHFYLGNDEFAVVIFDVVSAGVAVVFIENILAQFRKTFDIGQHSLKITINCGVAHNFSQHSDTNQIIFDSELALKQAKASNQPYIWLEKEEQQRSNRSKWRLLNSLHNAIEDDQLSLYYQPKVPLAPRHTRSKNHCGAEALIRWETLDQGVIAPKITLPLIEHLGSEIELIEWLVTSSLKYLQELDQEMEQEKSTIKLTPTVSVNIPPSLETTRVLPQIVSEALSLWSISPERLTLEITEDILIRDKEKAFDHLSKIRDLGVRISIDDFGTGYSSLAYFKHIPADELKIDQSFITNMISSEADKTIVRLIIDIAHAFDLTVVAEGVEDKATADLLIEMGCDYAQGFLYSKPIPKQDYAEWLNKNSHLYPAQIS